MKKLLEVNEILAESGGPLPMSKAGVYKALSEGKIPSVRVGRRVFIPSDFVERLMNDPK